MSDNISRTISGGVRYLKEINSTLNRRITLYITIEQVSVKVG